MEAKPVATQDIRNFAKVNAIIEKYGKKPEALIAILQEIQDEYRYLPEEILAYVATALNISPAKVFGVTTFYAQFSTIPKGKYIIQVCDGTACHVRGSNPLIETIQKTLNISEEKPTTDDLLFTLETVSCLGACGLAPVMVVNGKVFGEMTPEATKKLLLKLQSGEEILDD
ncbi:MAG: NAD(P)H-dependent oxidoreductase subunit E [Limnochordia bacterium]|nr:NAD(P)H-dependent oxidoreductase subunit E [Limnochordia bacterium]MDD2630272.1 NAD(P)H-dependent oxidoreductase subunit E [Limnochordia bacterium]MDD4518971.1 NAD(P)H-dependent oxidoreductase subunit E [Limnochordia bacterium]